MFFVGLASVLAQPAPQSGGSAPEKDREVPSGPLETRFFHLKHASSDELADVIHRLGLPGRAVADPRTNSLIVSAPASEIGNIEAVLAGLDVDTGDRKDSPAALSVIQLNNRRADEVAGRIASLIAGDRSLRDARVASDDARGKLIIRGPRTLIEMAQQVASQMDRPSQTTQMEFVFFQADQSQPPADAEGIPQDLAAVAKELERFGRIKLLGRLASVGLENQQFRIEGAIGQDMSAQINGIVSKASEDGTILVQIDSELRLSRVRPEKPGPPAAAGGGFFEQSGFKVSTTIGTRRGETVVIGTAPAGWKPGESAILVVQVRK
jgi:hypothetical protein